MSNFPRFMLAAASSGAGKTTMTIALLSALSKRGIKPVAFKCGPDYIDPMFHREVLGVPSYNLDLFMSSEETVRGLICEHAGGGGIAVIEGVMGYYDGIYAKTEASSFEVAKATATPAVLIVSAKGASLSVAAQIKGFLEFRKPSMIAGVILNDCSEALFNMLKEAIERETGTRLLGYFPRLKDCALGSRHLGLITAAEIEDLKQKIDLLGEQAAKSVDFELLLQIAGSAEDLSGALPDIEPVVSERVRIAVAQDRAFCFYYADSLELLEKLGAEIVPFSPLEDERLPEGIGALYLGGGYPELYAETLSKNKTMLKSVGRALEEGLPTLAECGGFLYLHDSMEDDKGVSYPMVGAIKGHGYKTPKLQRFGYIRLTAKTNTILSREGETIPGHEFHFWDTTAEGAACTAKKPSGASWPCVTAQNMLFAGFPHLYFYGNPEFARSFVRSAEKYLSLRA